MVGGLRQTVEILRASRNQAANDLLVDLVLEGPPSIREESLEALLSSRPRAALTPLVADFDLLGPAQQDQICRAGSATLAHALRQAYLSSDIRVHDNACVVMRRIPAYDQIPLILGALEQEPERKSRAVNLIEQLTKQLAADLDAAPDSASLAATRRQFLAALEVALRRFPRHRSSVVPEAFLILDNEDSELVRRVLGDPAHPCHAPMVDALCTRQEPRIVRWLFVLLASPHPPAAVIHIVTQRKDPWFVAKLLEGVSMLADPLVQASVKHIKEFPWLRVEPAGLGSMSSEQQKSALLWVTASGMSLPDKLSVVAFLLDEGHPESRRAAACTLTQFPGSDATQLLVGCLGDRDPVVQLAAVKQIRQRGLPNALALLMPKLEDPDPRVREAARQTLSDYGFEKYFRSFDQMDERSQYMIGSLVSKIDSSFDDKVRIELGSEHRNHRIRATRILRCLSRVESFWRDLARLVDDADHVVRRSAMDALEEVSDPAVVATLADWDAETAGNRRDALAALAQRGRTSEIRSAARDALREHARV